MQNKQATAQDYGMILDLWEQSVSATHHFLKEGDIDAIRQEIPPYFPHLDVRLWYKDQTLTGFSGTGGSHLEMLFLHPDWIGKGCGKEILHQLVQEFGVTSVDVNKDNFRAARFYMNYGFETVDESPTDSAGRPYPILHLKLRED